MQKVLLKRVVVQIKAKLEEITKKEIGKNNDEYFLEVVTNRIRNSDELMRRLINEIRESYVISFSNNYIEGTEFLRENHEFYIMAQENNLFEFMPSDQYCSIFFEDFNDVLKAKESIDKVQLEKSESIFDENDIEIFRSICRDEEKVRIICILFDMFSYYLNVVKISNEYAMSKAISDLIMVYYNKVFSLPAAALKYVDKLKNLKLISVNSEYSFEKEIPEIVAREKDKMGI